MCLSLIDLNGRVVCLFVVSLEATRKVQAWRDENSQKVTDIGNQRWLRRFEVSSARSTSDGIDK